MITDNVDWMDVEDNGATTGNGYAQHECEGGYKGRAQREGYTEIVIEKETPKTRYANFIQLGHAEYVTFDQPSYSADEDGEVVTITGKTNAPRLSFALIEGKGFAELPATFSITPEGGEAVTDQDVNGQVFVNDPGASAEIAFSISVTVAENTTIDTKQCTLVATGSDGVTGQTNIVQEGADNYIYVEEDGHTTASVSFPALPLSSQDVNVLSNDDWFVDAEIPSWLNVEDHGDLHLDGRLTFDARQYTGRESRSTALPLETRGGSSATITVTQSGKTAFISVQCIEDIKGSVVWTPAFNQNFNEGEGLYMIVGTSNCKNLFVSEDDGYTNIEAVDEGVNYTGFDLTESNGTTHNNVPTERDIEGDPGATAQYTVRIPFKLTENSGDEDREVSIDLYDSDYDDDPNTGTHTSIALKQLHMEEDSSNEESDNNL